MHGPFVRTCSLWVFLTMITVLASQQGQTRARSMPQEAMLAFITESNAELKTTPIDVPSTSQNTPERTGLNGTAQIPSSDEDKSEAKVIETTLEHTDPMDLHSRLTCDKGSCKSECPDSGSPSSLSSLRPLEVSYPHFGRSSSVTLECKCDKNCIVFGDCCYDYFSLCLGSNLTSLLSNVQTAEDVDGMVTVVLGDDDTVSEKASMFLYKVCHTVGQKVGNNSFWMISDCPRKQNKSDSSSQREYESKCRDKTLDPLGSVPASMIRDASIVFRNVFCALCNGIGREEVKLWKSFAECPGVESDSMISYKEFLSKLDECVVYSESIEGARACLPDRDEAVFMCPLYEKQGQTFRSNSLHCRSYVYPLTGYTGETISNWHCSACSKRMSFRDTKYRCDPHFIFFNNAMPVCQDVSCDEQCHKVRTNSKCQCQTDCFLFGDCCYDFIPECLGQELKLSDVSGNETLIGRLMYDENPSTHHDLKLLYVNHRVCESVPGSKDTMRWVIGSCPRNNQIQQCSSIGKTFNRTLLTPASHKKHPDIIFRNIYCGHCHGIPSEDLNQWSTSIHCSKPVQSFVSENELLLNGTCVLKAVELKGGRYCSQEDNKIVQISPETPNYNLSRLLCHAYRYPVHSKPEHVVRNPHCEQIMGIHSCAPKGTDTNGATTTESKKGGLSILFNFNENGVTFESRDGVSMFPEISCQIDEVYDDYHDRCKKLQCQQGKVANNGSCVRNGTWFAEDRNMVFVNGTKQFILAFYILTEKTFKENDVYDIMHEVITDREIIRYQYLLEPSDLAITNVSHLPYVLKKNSSRYKDGGKHIKLLQISFVKTGSVHQHLNAFSLFVQRLLDNTENAENILDVSVQNFVSENQITCSFGKVTELTNISMEMVSEVIYANDSDVLYPLDNVAFVCGIIRNIPHLRKVFVCDIPLNCDPVAYNLTDFTLEDGVLKSLHSDLVLANNSYFVQGNEVLSCHNFSRSFLRNQSNIFFRFDHVQDILTYVTSGISVVSLILTLTVYIILPELHNLPGRLTMSLSACLMLAQGMLLLIHLPTGVLCQTLAITLHFLWLCSFMWMTAMSINLAQTFTRKMKGSSMSSTAGSHARFSLFVVGFPLVIVTVSAVLDFLDIPNIDIGYGKHGLCWIANPRASLLVFGVPLALIILVNLIAFIVTFYNIEKSLRASKDISSTKGDRYKVIIYGKLFIIMGLSWGFSFAAAFADFAALWYIFILMNGLQGFYIFISFVCTDRVKRLLKKKILGPDVEESKTTKTEPMNKI